MYSLLEIDGDAEARKLADRALRLRPGGKEASAIIDALWQRAEKQRVRVTFSHVMSNFL
jgi:hypothetical protein